MAYKMDTNKIYRVFGKKKINIEVKASHKIEGTEMFRKKIWGKKKNL